MPPYLHLTSGKPGNACNFVLVNIYPLYIVLLKRLFYILTSGGSQKWGEDHISCGRRVRWCFLSCLASESVDYRFFVQHPRSQPRLETGRMLQFVGFVGW